MYQNIVSEDITSYRRYAVIAKYLTKEECIANYERDINYWKRETKRNFPKWYSKHYPFAFASIKVGEE